ncbi:golgin subfamily A member 6-like protein 6 [Linepithema humile]|uniref:golgin subfamily A member 6-like protein 6 n=1 Tax=Linepithema humile TaxID=83485 RepID=UPI00351F0ACE
MADRFDICERMRMEDDILMMNEESLLNGDVDVDVDLVAVRSVAACSVAARSVAVRDVAADSVAARSVAVRDVAAGSVAAGPVAAGPVAAGPIAAGSVAARSVAVRDVAASFVAAGPVAADSMSSKQNRQDREVEPQELADSRKDLCNFYISYPWHITGADTGEEAEEEVERTYWKNHFKKNASALVPHGWRILNGCTEGKEEGEYTFTGRKGNTVIDYVIADEDTRGKIKRLRIEDNIESDHQPVEVWVKGEGQRQKGKRSGNRGKGKIWRGVWNEEGCNKFKQRIEGLKSGEEEMRVEWEGIERKMKEAIKEMERDLGKEEGKRRGWWDRECEEKKKEARRELRGWRRKGGEGKEYKEKKKEYKEMCERKKKEENERWEKRAREVKRENEVWEIINRERKRRVKINDGIEMEEWKEYFMRLLGGTEGKVVKGGERKKGEEGEEEEKISRKEIKEAIKKLRNGKAMGVDGIPGKAWKYGEEEVEEWVWNWYIEKEMGQVKWGGVKLRGRKVYSLAYADDMVLIAEEEEEMKGMMEKLERYLDRKNLELNTEKTKIMRFRKGGGRWKKKVWRWKGKTIEEVKEFRYLGYIIQRNGGQGAQIRERVRKATTVMG